MKLDWKHYTSLPADNKIRMIGVVQVKHVPATTKHCQCLMVKTEDTLYRRRFVNGKWLHTEHISGVDL
jgi:hypothetical protein